jgi:hypothetical protein
MVPWWCRIFGAVANALRGAPLFGSLGTQTPSAGCVMTAYGYTIPALSLQVFGETSWI